MPQTHPGSAQPRTALRPVTADAMPPLRAPRLLDQVREGFDTCITAAHRAGIRALVQGLHPLSRAASP